MRLLKFKPDGAPSERYLIIGNVKHSQSMSATFCHPWFVAEKGGEIRAAHCDCMAGLGEACSHIAAIISSVARAVQMRGKSGEDACTSQLCAWLPPNRNCTPAKVKEINFTSPSTKRRIEESPATVKRKPPSTGTEKPFIAPPTEEEISALYATLNQCKSKPGILRVLDDYSDQFVPIYEAPKYPKPLSSLYDPSQLKVGYLDLLRHCEAIYETIQITDEEVKAVERDTRDQSASKLWHYQRTGRITASNFKAVARTDPTWHSESLIKRLSHPESYSFSTEATRWGCDHESDGIRAYLNEKEKHHHSASFQPAGFVICKKYPFIGASPDGWVCCAQCGPGILEVKCPYSCREKLPQDNTEAKKFCMSLVGNQWKLDEDHTYYYQVQTQLFVTNVPYCDFIVWTPNGLRVDRILRKEEDFYKHFEKVSDFFKYSILPELVGKWLTRRPVINEDGIVVAPAPAPEDVQSTSEQTDSARTWCYCDQPSTDELVQCGNKDCTILKFHMACLRIRCPPKPNQKWYCPSCRRLPKFSRSKKKN